ncbi:MAG: hypothetical protein HC794_05785 [Nitrospiraceae bacterium]|nr:hypothetical protein [Nitrospiraceae bacterium]
MFAFAGNPSLGGSPLTWNLFFARQPEPDLEFTEEELEQTTTVRSPSPKKPPKQSSGRPLLWVLLLVLIGGGAYVAMEPEMVMEYIEPLLGESPTPEPPTPIVQRPVLPKPAPVAPPPQPMDTAPTPPPAVVPAEMAQAATAPAAPVPMPPSASPMPTPSATAEAIPTPAPTSDASMTSSPPPLFSEGQRVSVLPNPAAPSEKIVLTQDPEGSRPGLAIPPGTILTILDGDLQGTGWVYSVRSNYGTTGWLPEHQLKLKP